MTKKIRKYFLVFILLIIFCGNGLTYNYEHLYKLEYLESKLEKYLLQGWSIHKVEIQYLDSLKNLPNDKEYIVVHANKPNSNSILLIDEYAYSNQIIVFEWQGEDLALVWRSDEYLGDTMELDFIDIDNNGNRNINVKVNRKDTEIYRTLLMYDWTKVNTKKIYPLGDHKILRTNKMFQFFDYDYDQDHEIIVTQVLQHDPYQYKKEYYLFKNGQLSLENEKSLSVQQGSNNKMSSNYPLISNVVEEVSSGELQEVYKLHYNHNLYLVQVKELDIETESTNLIIEKEDEVVKFMYKLDKRINGLGFVRDLTSDFNNDGYLEIVFYNIFKGEYYIISLSSVEPELITPTDEDFNSLIKIVDKWDSELYIYDLDGDSVPELTSQAIVDGDLSLVYWKWNPSKRCYEIYQK